MGQATGGVAGCGVAEGGLTLGDLSCGPLRIALTPAFCDSDQMWVCESGAPLETAYKVGPAGGGVLCCR